MPIHRKTRICCWHEIHFDIQIYIRSPTLSISPYIKNRESAAGMIFISIFKSIFNPIDIHMPIHKKKTKKKPRICCWHEIHFDIQIYIQLYTPSIFSYIKNRESAAGMIFISIFKSVMNLIDFHMPIH